MKKSVTDLSAKKEEKLKFIEKVGINTKTNNIHVSFINKIKNIGFGSTFLYKAYESIKSMTNSKILLCYTSNIISSGCRDIILELVKNKKVNALLTTGGGIEEDIIKSLDNNTEIKDVKTNNMNINNMNINNTKTNNTKTNNINNMNIRDNDLIDKKPCNLFYLANFNLSGKELRNNGFNRIGNLVIPNENYEEFEKFINKVLVEELSMKSNNDNKGKDKDKKYNDNDNKGKDKDKKYNDSNNSNTFSVLEFTKILGKHSKDSILYHAFKNNIPVFSSGVVDGSIGDILTFNKKNKIEIDLVRDSFDFYNFFNKNNFDKSELIENSEKINEWSVIILGDGSIRYRVIKNIKNIKNFVIITTRDDYDGSDIGSELIKNSNKVIGDVSIIFPLLMYETLLKNE
ncbi:Deoxyhypusine synthase [Dictyocoela muelleri]|nr:Deoxyhypusine synthase [Dictyocoela muelleri]